MTLPLRVESIWFLAALPALLVWVWWLGARSYAQLAPWARRASLALRVSIVVCLVAALARPLLLHQSQQQHVIFLLDVSRSIGKDNLDGGIEAIDRLAKQAADLGHRVSVIAFGRQARVVVPPQRAWGGWTAEDREMLAYQFTLPGLYAERTSAVSSAASAEQRQAIDQRIARYTPSGF